MAKSIGTHDGTFHCDDALACFMLKLLPEYADANIIRTRDAAKLEGCDIVVDVGAVFDHNVKRYDHHQKEFKETFNSLNPKKKWVTKLSSAGLVYVFYGREIIRTLIGEVVTARNCGTNPAHNTQLLEKIYDLIYEKFVEEIDAVDNGIAVADGVPRYAVTSTISQRVANLLPFWNEESSDALLLDRFYNAMELVGGELKDKVKYYVCAWLPAFDLVQKSVLSRKDVHSSGEIIVLDEGGAPWKDHLYNLEEELDLVNQIKYVLYTDTSGKWRVHCVSVRAGSFENRLSLPKAWCGLRDDALSKVSGIEGCVFVHANGFIGGNLTYNGALQMAVKSLEMQESS